MAQPDPVRASPVSPEPGFFVTGGTVRPGAPSYVEREADREIYAALRRMEFCYVLDTRQMGKSSLMARIGTRLRDQDRYSVATVDLTACGQSVTIDQWYDAQLTIIGKHLNLRRELEDFSDEHEELGALDRWKRAIREVVLERIEGPVVIFIDEIDYVRSLPFPTDEFFAGIREFHNARPADPALDRLAFCLLGVATPQDLIRSEETTPFNIARKIVLTDFNEQDPGTAALRGGLSSDEDTAAAMLKRVLHWTGGHPYLTQKLCDEVIRSDAARRPVYAHGPSGVDDACRQLFLTQSARDQNDNLRFVASRILNSAKPEEAISKYALVRAGQPVSGVGTDPWIDVLRLSGIVKIRGDRLEVRNEVYRRVFDEEWVRKNLTPEEVLRQEAAAKVARRQALMVGSGVVGILLALVAIVYIVVIAGQKSRIAEQNKQLLVAQQSALAETQKATSLSAQLMNRNQALSEAVNLSKELSEQIKRDAEARERDLKAQRDQANSRGASAQAEYERSQDESRTPLALLLGIQAVGRSVESSAYRNLRQTVQAIGLYDSKKFSIGDDDKGAISPNGSYLALSYKDKSRVCIYDTKDLSEVKCFPTVVTGKITLADDGRIVVSQQSSDGGGMRCGSIRRDLAPCGGIAAGVPDVAIGSDAAFIGWLATGSNGNELKIADIASGSPPSSISLPAFKPRNEAPLPPGPISRDPAINKAQPHVVALSAKGRYAIVTDGDRASLYDSREGRVVQLAGNAEPSFFIEPAETAETLLVAGDSLWNLSKGSALNAPGKAELTLQGYAARDVSSGAAFRPVEISPNGNWLAYKSNDGHVKLMDRASSLRNGLAALASDVGESEDFIVSSSGAVAMSARDERSAVRISQAGSKSMVPGNVAVAFTGNRLVVFADRDKSLSIWNPQGYRGIEHDTPFGGGSILNAGNRFQLVSPVTPAAVLRQPRPVIKVRETAKLAVTAAQPVPPSFTSFINIWSSTNTFHVSQSGTLAAVEQPGGIQIESITQGGAPRTLATSPDASIRALSPDGRWIAVEIANAGNLEVHDTQNPAAAPNRFRADASAAAAFTQSADGRVALAVASKSGTLRLLDLHGEQLQSKSSGWNTEDGIFSEDGALYAAVSSTPAGPSTAQPANMLLWRVRENQLTVVPLGSGTFRLLAFSSKGDVAAVGDGGSVRFCRAPAWSMGSKYTLPADLAQRVLASSERAFAFDPGGTSLTLLGPSGLHFMNVETGAIRTVGPRFSGYRLKLVGVSARGDAVVLENGSELSVFAATEGKKTSVAEDVANAFLIHGGSGLVSLEGIGGPPPGTKLAAIDPLHPASDVEIEWTEPPWAVAASAGRLALGGQSGVVAVYQVASPKAPPQEFRSSSPVRSVGLTQDGQSLAAARDSDLTLYQLPAGTSKRADSPGPVSAIAFTGNGRQLVAAVMNGMLAVYDVPQMTLIQKLTAGPDIHSLLAAPKGDVLAAVGRQGAWLCRTGLWTCRRVGGEFDSGVFSSDGRHLALIEGNAVHILDATTGTEEYILRHQETVASGAFSPDAAHFAAATESSDSDAANGVRLWKLGAHGANPGEPGFKDIGFIQTDDPPTSVAFTPDGVYLSIQASDKVLVTLWRRADLIREACRRIPAGMTLTEEDQKRYSLTDYRDYCAKPDLVVKD